MVGTANQLPLRTARLLQQLAAWAQGEWLGRLLQDNVNVSQLLPLPGGPSGTKTEEDRHKLEGGLGTWCGVGHGSLVFSHCYQVLWCPQWLECNCWKDNKRYAKPSYRNSKMKCSRLEVMLTSGKRLHMTLNRDGICLLVREYWMKSTARFIILSTPEASSHTKTHTDSG